MIDAMNHLARRRGADVATVRIPEPATRQVFTRTADLDKLAGAIRALAAGA